MALGRLFKAPARRGLLWDYQNHWFGVWLVLHPSLRPHLHAGQRASHSPKITGYRDITPIMENQTEKNLEENMEHEINLWLIQGVRV